MFPHPKLCMTNILHMSLQLPNKGKTLPLLRIRNPWGTGEGEWKGAWSYGTKQWLGVSDSDKEKLSYKTAINGEFWISLKDFYAYFWRTFICNFTPDFTRDGTPDGLSKCVCVSVCV